MFVIRTTVLTFATVKVCNGERRLLPKHKHVNLESGKLRADTRHAAESERAGEPRETHTHTHTYSFTPRESDTERERARGQRASERAGGRTREREFHIKTLRFYYDYDAGATRVVGCQGTEGYDWTLD